MRVLFVHPFALADSALERALMTPYPPLGLLSLAAVAREAGHSVALYDRTFNRAPLPGAEGLAEYRAVLSAMQPDVVCVGAMVTLRPAATAVCRESAAAGVPVIAGGPDPTAAPGPYLRAGAAAVQRGEAEAGLPMLLEAVARGATLSTLPGIATRRHPHPAGHGPLVEDLDALPLPARDLVAMEDYFAAWREAHGYTSLTIAAGRGCPLDCDACADGARAHFRLRSPASVAGEMLVCQAQWSPDRFRIVDELTALEPGWLDALDREMESRGVVIPYEGLRPAPELAQRHFAPVMDLCGARTRWIASEGPHGAPLDSPEEVYRVWSRMPTDVAAADP
jgi:radical SAM superfamily enzyme YgiQ (UPF0313 family)